MLHIVVNLLEPPVRRGVFAQMPPEGEEVLPLELELVSVRPNVVAPVSPDVQIAVLLLRQLQRGVPCFLDEELDNL